MLVDRSVAALRPLSITWNSFVMFSPANSQHLISGLICCVLFLHSWPRCVSGWSLEEVLSPHWLTCMISMFTCKQRESQPNRVNKTESKSCNCLLVFPSHRLQLPEWRFLISEGCTTMAPESASSTFAVLALASKQGYVRKKQHRQLQTNICRKSCNNKGSCSSTASVWCRSWKKTFQSMKQETVCLK